MEVAVITRFITPGVRLLLGLAAAAVMLLLLSQLPDSKPAQAHPVSPFLDGEIRGDGSAACSDFFITFLGLFDTDIPDPSWTPVNKGNPGYPQFRSVSGEVMESRVSYTDYPDVHDSHDAIFDIMVDPGLEDVLSDANRDHNGDGDPDSIEVEWEAGIKTNEFSGDGSLHFFPKWAWPSEGDRVWTNGDWIFDCGHPSDIEGKPHARSEIHPARAVASMRQQMRTLPGSGTTPVPVTATDLYMHGRAGFVTDMLDCGDQIILGPTPACPGGTPFGPHDPVADHHPRAIDEDFEFDVCLPPLPFDKAALATFVEDGPGNSVAIAPVLTPQPSVGACAADPAQFGPTQLHVEVPLAGSGATPDDVYARKIYAGWVFPPENLKHLKLTLNKMDLHDDLEPDFFDCECTFFWMNVDRAPDEWIRLADFATGNMNDYDSDEDLGNGEMVFSGAEFDYYIANNLPYTVRANGYDGGFGDSIPGADCLDDHFGEHDFASHIDISVFPPAIPDFCYVVMSLISADIADNDDFAKLNQSFGPADYTGAKDVTASGQYELEFSVEEIPLSAGEGGEDAADLSIDKDCKPDEPVYAGVQFTCTITVVNYGPGLPRNVVVDDVLLTNVDPADYTLTDPTFTFPGVGFSDPCEPVEDIAGGVEVRCEIGTVPVGGKAIISFSITSDEGGDFNNLVRVFTDSTDPDTSNNESRNSVHVTPVADLSITKSDSEDPLVSGTTLTYTLDITNHGPSTAVNVVVEDFLPAGVSIASVSGTGGASCVFGVPGDNSRPTTCNFDSLAPSASRTMTIVVTVLPGIHNFLHNDARVSSDVLDLDNSDNIDGENTLVKVADLEITKTSDKNVYKSSAQVVYTLTIHNNGPSDAQGVVVTDDLPINVKLDRVYWLPGAPICTKPPGGKLLTCSLGTIAAGGTKTITIIVVFKGSRGIVSNTADVTSTTTDPDLGNNASTRTVLVGSLPKP